MENLPIPYLLKVIVDKIRTEADAHLKSIELTLSQSRVLGFIVHQGSETTQKEIEDYLQVSHPTVVGIVSRMEKNGFLTSRYERTSKVVTLTQKAQATGEDMVNTMIKQDEILFKGLSKEEVAELNRILIIIYNNVK